MSKQAELISDMLRPDTEASLRGALERFYATDKLRRIWPSALLNGGSDRLPLEDVKIIVLPLDRIGAPAGASGAGVYVVYYSHNAAEEDRKAPSQPLVVKIGPPRSLSEEKQGADQWPKLTSQQMGRFAFPLHYDDTDAEVERAVLLAPFNSISRSTHGGSRNDVEVRDLWRLLDDKDELSGRDKIDWAKVSGLIAQALDVMEPPHQGGRGKPSLTTVCYADQFERYLRKTTETGEKGRSHMPAALFGDGSVTEAFGRKWVNPALLVRRVLHQRMSFASVLGPVHGDLHPKNIVLDAANAVQIIDFGWATINRPIVVDYLLLDLNLRGITLPSQISEQCILKLASFLRPEHNLEALPHTVRGRAKIIQDVIWHKASERVVRHDWATEYMIPLLLVGYGLLVHLDSARNQPALIATVLQLAQELDAVVPSGLTA